MAKINVLVVPSDNIGGVGFYRSTQPHIQLQEQFPDDFEVTIDMQPNFRNLPWFDKFQIVHIHKALFQDMQGLYMFLDYAKQKGIKTIMDIDDYWDLGMHHPQAASQRQYKIDKIITDNLSKFDYVTTTTPLFAKKIAKYNKDVFVFPNAINPEDERFKIEKKPSKYLRVGLIMGSTHEYDVALLNNISSLPKDVLEKVQFVLCGFDLRGTIKTIDKSTGKVTQRPIQPKESVWYRYEKMVTDNYRIVDKDYKDFLELFLNNVQYPNVENEHYKRCWTKDINHYYSHYNEIDVLLAPIEENDFNYVKSPLKVAECAFSHTAIVASNFGPYTLDLTNARGFGGTWDLEANSLLVDETRNHKDWKKYVEILARNPEYVKQLQDNLYRDVHEKYDLRNVTKDRAEFYKKIVNG
ncbi:MAG: glycosyltransferase [Paludibacteraceae bacterium]|nr:glycosyltransferase [Paludibacteraceae bacterium]